MANYPFYLGTYTNPNVGGPQSEGIYRAVLEGESGQIRDLRLVARVKNPSFVALSRDGRRLYAVCEIEGSAVAAWAIEGEGEARFLGSQASSGGGACHLCLDAKQKNVLVANYGGGSVASFPIVKDGGLSAARAVVQHQGSGPNLRRQEKPHAHAIYGDESGRFAYACDLGTDQVKIYAFEAATGALTPAKMPAARVLPGAGPRHLALHPRGYAYVNNEMGLSVTVFKRDLASGALRILQNLPTLPSGAASQGATTAEIALHPSGDWLYVSNRGHNTIAAYCVGGDGFLSLIGHFATPNEPRGFGISGDGKWLVVGGQKAHQIAAYSIDARTGNLQPKGQNVAVGAPVCVVFAPEPRLELAR